jgi:hypothetical protein
MKEIPFQFINDFADATKALLAEAEKTTGDDDTALVLVTSPLTIALDESDLGNMENALFGVRTSLLEEGDVVDGQTVLNSMAEFVFGMMTPVVVSTIVTALKNNPALLARVGDDDLAYIGDIIDANPDIQSALDTYSLAKLFLESMFGELLAMQTEAEKNAKPAPKHNGATP